MALIDNVIDPTEQIAGITQSEWGDRWWQWDATTPQDDNPVRDRTGDFAAINQTGPVYFLVSEGNGIANRINVIVPAGKYLFFPTSNFASLGNNLAEFGGDTRFANPGNPGGIGDIAYYTQLFNNPTNFSLTIDGTSVLQFSDAKKYIQSTQNLTDGFSYTTPENSSIFPGAVPDGTTFGKNWQTGYYIGLEPLDQGKHTIHFTTTVDGRTQDINYEIEVKSFNEIAGNNSNNTINGTASHDDIDALGGSDTVNGFGGDDIIDAGAGDDTVSGGDGNDIVYGGAGKDTLNGDAGDDVLAGGLADDVINGGVGSDRLYGGSGKDTIKGDSGDDQIFGGLGNDIIDGGVGNDTIDAVAYSRLVLPVIPGAPGEGEIDTLKGGAGKDLFVLGMAGGTGVTGAGYYIGSGNNDYALIQDFTLGTDGDKIQLYSQTLNPNDYKLDSAPAGTPSGVGIFGKYFNAFTGFFSWDLVGIIQGVSLSSLSLTNSSQFTFVNDTPPVVVPTITLAVAPNTVTEDGTGKLVYTFTRTGATTSALTVNYGVAGTADLTTDYTQTGAASFTNTNGTVTFAAGSATAKVTIDPKSDTTVEENETVALTLASGTGYTVGTTGAVIGSISNDDTGAFVPTITLAVAPNTVTEDGTTNLVYTFTRMGGSTSDFSALTVNYGVGGTAGLTADYTQTGAASFTSTAGTVTFAAGATTATVIIDPKADTTVEADETVALTLASGTGYTVGTTAAVIGKITNDDTAAFVPTITLAVAPNTVTEDGTNNLVYTFTRTGGSTSFTALTVNYGVGGTAGLTADYTQTGAASFTNTVGTVTFAAGSATATVTIDPKADTTVEADETVRLTLATGTGYTVGTTAAVIGTITNDDTAAFVPTITLDVAPNTVTEDGAGKLVYTFTRTGSTTSFTALTVNYGVGGTAGLTADYTQTGAASFTNTAGTVTFAAGSATATVIIDPKADTTVEADEMVALTLASGNGYGNGYTVGTTGAVTGTITNDDTAAFVPTITLDVSPNTVTEDGAGKLVYTFTRTGSSTSFTALTVNYGVAGTAGLTADYTQTGAASFTNTAGTVTFAAGSATATVTIDPKADTTVEANETVRLTLATGTGYTVGTTGAVIGTITNDDQPVTSNQYIIDPTKKIAGKTQSEWGDKWWQWHGSTPQDDNPVRDRSGDFAAVNQTGPVYFLTNNQLGTSSKNAIVAAGKYLFLPTINYASLGNNLAALGGDTRFVNSGNDGGIGDIEFSTQIFNSISDFSVTVDGKSVVNFSDAKKYLQSTQNLTDGFSFIAPENNSIFPGQVQDGETIGKDYQTGYYLALKPLDPGKHTIRYTINVGGRSKDTTYEIEVKSFNEILGDHCDNTINGTSGHDDIDAFGGEDTVYGYGGDDIIDVGTGDDTVYGGNGKDIVYGGAGEDRIEGDYGDDVLAGGLGDDTIIGGYGNDRLYGGSGCDNLVADIGDDMVFGGLGDDSIDGGKGNDIIDAVAYSPLVLPVFFLEAADGTPIRGKAGQGEIDKIKGARGNDTFVLGSAGTAYYVGDGKCDYALIEDFTLGADGDKIQLYSKNLKPSDYVLGSAPGACPSGVGIFTNDAAHDLVSIIQGVSISSLSLTNSSQFTFVS